jgi:voltage-gated potassium channel
MKPIVDDRVNFRRQLYYLLDSSAWPRNGLSPLNRFLVLFILVSVLVAILESEPLVYRGHEADFFRIEFVFAAVFLIEYLARLWVCVENPRYANGWRGRLSYALTPAALFDLLAVTPLVFTMVGTEAFVLRLFRMVGILRLSKLGRYSAAMTTIRTAILSRRYELIMSVGIAGIMLLVSSTLLYIVEGAIQPDAFGSIPRAMWWSIAALTTVGYGDVVPVTPLGRVLAGVTAIIGIGLIAMPTGILAAAFSDALAEQRAKALEAREGSQSPTS